MAYHLDFSIQAEKDIDFHKKAGDEKVTNKLLILLTELIEHPYTYTGAGKPEQLKYNLAGFWSRRINREHRLVYKVVSDKVLVHSAKGHY
jgi:toxin YoeB